MQGIIGAALTAAAPRGWGSWGGWADQANTAGAAGPAPAPRAEVEWSLPHPLGTSSLGAIVEPVAGAGEPLVPGHPAPHAARSASAVGIGDVAERKVPV